MPLKWISWKRVTVQVSRLPPPIPLAQEAVVVLAPVAVRAADTFHLHRKKPLLETAKVFFIVFPSMAVVFSVAGKCGRQGNSLYSAAKDRFPLPWQGCIMGCLPEPLR